MAVKKFEGLVKATPKDLDQLYDRNNAPKVCPVIDERITTEKGLDGHPVGSEAIAALMDPGFVQDFVHSTRGFESPTEFCLWAALFGVSSVGQRRMWITHGFDRLFTNLFLIFIGKAGVVRKSTTIKHVESLLKRVPSLYDPDDGSQAVFRVPIHTGKSTPEALYDLLAPEEVMIRDEDMLDSEVVKLGSRLVLTADELSSFLGKQTYNVGLTDLLLKLYDCKDYDEIITKKEGLKRFENIFFNFFAGSTIDGFRSSVPDSAQASGFLSRLLIVYAEDTQREFAIPMKFKGAPDRDELTRRLGWIGHYKQGDYHLDEQAQAHYENWYSDVKKQYRWGRYTDVEARIEIHTLKIAALLRAQAYSLSRTITLNDIKLAKLLVEQSIDYKRQVAEKMAAPGYQQNYQMVLDFLRSNGPVSRKLVNQSLGRKLKMAEIDEVLASMVHGSVIKVELDGERRRRVSSQTRETYTLVGEKEDGEQDVLAEV